MSRPWSIEDPATNSWSEPNAEAAEPHLKHGEKRRMESVFANSSWQPQQMVPLGTSGRDQEKGHMPSAYQSLPSDASGQFTWPMFQSSPGRMGQDTFPNSGHYSSIDQLLSTSHVEGDGNRSHQNFAQPLETGSFSLPASNQPFKIPSVQSQGFTIQYGRLAATTQREADQRHSADQAQGWSNQYDKAKRAEYPLISSNAFELQEMYHSQSDALENIMRSSRAMQDRFGNHSHHLGNQGADLDAELNDLVGYVTSSVPLQRANSALEPLAMPQRSLGSSYQQLEPYMPGWSSESVPAELPNHLAERLQRRGQSPAMGMRLPTHSLPAPWPNPSGRQNPFTGVLHNHQSLGLGDNESLPALPDSPKAHQLEELARTADAEVAHRAFLVPAHKKRGKGGRQPATDPRLDPNIDERKAKRILANRLSAARSKMKQKNQMENFGKLVSEIQKYIKGSKEDAAELMETCEKLELQNRKLTGDLKILEEYHARLHAAQGGRLPGRTTMQHNSQPSFDTLALGHANLDLFN